MTWVAADNNYQYVTRNDGTIAYTFSGMKNDPFPYGSVNAFGKNTTPAATLYNENSDGSYYLDSSITDITQNSDGTISFNFNGESNMVPPYILADESLTFNTTVGTPQIKQIEMISEGLTEDVIVTLTDDNNVFSIDKTSISKADSEEGAIVNVTFRSFTAGTYTGTVTLSSAGADPVTVSLSATATPVTVPTLTVTDVTATTADVSWTACDGVSSYTLQLASDDQFTTGGGGETTTLIEESFEDDIPTGWITSSSGIAIVNGKLGDETYCVAFKESGAYLITEAVENPTSVSFMYKRSNKSNPWGLDISVSPSIDGPWTSIGSISSAETSWNTYETNFTASGTVYLKFTDTRESGAQERYVDLITITGSSAPSGGGSLIAEETVTGTSYTFTGLTPETTYYARVKGDDDWSNVASFTTDAPADQAPVWSAFPATTVYVGEDFDITISDYVTGTPAPTIELTSSTANADDYDFEDGYLVFQPSAAGTFTFTFTATNSEGSAVATLTIEAVGEAPELTASLGTSLNTYVGDDVDFTVTATGHPTPTIEATCTEGAYFVFENGEFFFDCHAAGTYHFVFNATNVFGTDELTVTITVSPAPVTVPDLTVSNVTDDTALASWTACDGVTEYTLQLVSDDQSTTSSPILSENFKGFTGNDADVIGSNGTLDKYTSTTGWTGSKVYTANEMAKIGATSSQGWIMTPALNASGTLTVVWSAFRYGNSDENTLLLGVSENGTDFVEETITIGDEIATFTNTFTVFGPTVYVRWRSSAAYKARFYLDDISISTEGSLIASETVNGTSYTFDNLEPETTYYARVKGNAGWSNVEEFKTKEVPVDITLADGTNNTSVIEENDRAYANVTLSGRTLYKDGDWNTLCLPFNVVLTGSPLEGADVRELSNTIETAGVKTGLDDNGVLTLNFTAENGITELVAGTPYLIKWAKANDYVDDNDHNIWEPVFNGVTIDATDRKFTSTDGKVEFKGNYNARTFDSENKSILFLGNASTLYYPESNASIGACRAFFEIADAALVRTFNLNFGEESTMGISLTPGPIPEQSSPTRSLSPKGEGSIYTLDGRKLDGKPTKKGLYIRNGKVVVIK